jgi:hypothetical protein
VFVYSGHLRRVDSRPMVEEVARTGRCVGVRPCVGEEGVQSSALGLPVGEVNRRFVSVVVSVSWEVSRAGCFGRLLSGWRVIPEGEVERTPRCWLDALGRAGGPGAGAVPTEPP